MTQQEANTLLSCKKAMLKGEVTVIYFPLKIDGKQRMNLISEPDGENYFLWEIYQSKKKLDRVTLHFQEKDFSIPLMRLDYGSSHRNPVIALDGVPEEIKTYAGYLFKPNEPHLHIYVESYPNLAWAIPANIYKYPSLAETWEDKKNSILIFQNAINLDCELDLSYEELVL